jgi:hypothetical protein
MVVIKGSAVAPHERGGRAYPNGNGALRPPYGRCCIPLRTKGLKRRVCHGARYGATNIGQRGT